jgi:hypothetical protein
VGSTGSVCQLGCWAKGPCRGQWPLGACSRTPFPIQGKHFACIQPEQSAVPVPVSVLTNLCYSWLHCCMRFEVFNEEDTDRNGRPASPHLPHTAGRGIRESLPLHRRRRWQAGRRCRQVASSSKIQDGKEMRATSSAVSPQVARRPGCWGAWVLVRGSRAHFMQLQAAAAAWCAC